MKTKAGATAYPFLWLKAEAGKQGPEVGLSVDMAKAEDEEDYLLMRERRLHTWGGQASEDLAPRASSASPTSHHHRHRLEEEHHHRYHLHYRHHRGLHPSRLNEQQQQQQQERAKAGTSEGGEREAQEAGRRIISPAVGCTAAAEMAPREGGEGQGLRWGPKQRIATVEPISSPGIEDGGNSSTEVNADPEGSLHPILEGVINLGRELGHGLGIGLGVGLGILGLGHGSELEPGPESEANEGSEGRDRSPEPMTMSPVVAPEHTSVQHSLDGEGVG
ncbi:unnamed protein product, partial [Discosporangium mesarthrocarpum]